MESASLVAIALFGLIVMVTILWRRYRAFSTLLDHIPGPPGDLLVGNALQMADYSQFFKLFAKYAKEYGPVYKVRLMDLYFVVVSDARSLHELLLQKGKESAGRYTTWRIRYALKDTGILFSTQPDETWRRLRKISHSHLKQFGEGMTRLQDVISDVAEDMFEEFQKNQAKPLDPKGVIMETSLKSIALLITGRRYQTGDRLLEQMKMYETHNMKYIVSSAPPQYMLMDTFPWTRYIMPTAWSNVRTLPNLEKVIWNDITKAAGEDDADKLDPENEGVSLAKLLMSFTKVRPESGDGEVYFTETDAKRTCLSLLLAGFATTSSTFHAMVNILAHNPKVQDKIAAEIGRPRQNGDVTLRDRPHMDYSKACILEILRYFTVANAGVPHAAMQDFDISGYKIPKGIAIITNLYGLHHDKSFWGDPESFRPERFLDADGAMLPADHPNRRNLLPFSTGPRVCLGESLAMARLFLWTTNMVQRFHVSPAPGNDVSLTQTDSYYSESILYSKPYSVIFTPRSYEA